MTAVEGIAAAVRKGLWLWPLRAPSTTECQYCRALIADAVGSDGAAAVVVRRATAGRAVADAHRDGIWSTST